MDRDGVINRFPGKGLYVTRQKDFAFLPGSLSAIRLLTEAGHELRVVSNQGCVSRGYITKDALLKMTTRMLDAISKKGGKIRQVHYCLHQTSDGCGCKKPKLGLIRKAVKGRRSVLKDSFFVGDSQEDMELARKAGSRAVLVLSGRLRKKDVAALASPPDVVKKNLLEAARWILKKTP